jgi:hypothetical protein
VIFGAKPEELIAWLEKDLVERNRSGQGERAHILPYRTKTTQGTITVEHPAAQLAVGTLQNSLDAYVKAMKDEHPEIRIDYIHGDDVVEALVDEQDAVGFLLPAMAKEDLFLTVIREGALPRKTFSMGEANEKRFYMECRRIK